MSAARKLGWKKDRADARDHDARVTLLKAAPPPPASANNFGIIKTLDQKQLGSCTCNATAQVIRAAELVELVANDVLAGASYATALAARQISTPFFSRLFAYWFARSYDHDTANDDGTEIRLVFQALNKYGFPPESAWPYSDANPGPFQKMPSADAIRLAYDQRYVATAPSTNLVDYARITSTDAALIVDVKTAAAAGHLVAFGTLVTEAFCSDMTGNGGTPIARPSSATAGIAGGHAMTIIGYDALGAIVLNSWGDAYGGADGLPPGCFRMAWDYLTWAQSSDFWIAKHAPIIAKAS